MLDMWLEGVGRAFTLLNLGVICGGTLVGIIFGALPGLGPTVAVTLMIPVTFGLRPDSALILLAAVYAGCIYGGSISAILLNAPGEPGSAATTFDGYPMSQKGQAGVALGLSVNSSLLGGIFSAIALITLSPIIAVFSLRFGPAELCMLAIFGLAIIAVVSKANLRRGLMAGGLGLMFSFVGQDLITAQFRFDFGIIYLQDGLAFIVALIGMFAGSEAILLSERKGSISRLGKVMGGVIDGIKLTFKYPVTLLRSSIIGTIIGAIPGAGLSAANFLAYMETIRSSKHPETFGQGDPEGVVAAESSNNAVTGGSLIPTLTVGIPGNSTTAAFLGGVMIHGLRPGMELFTTHGPITYALFTGFILANVCFFIMGVAGTNIFAKITLIRNDLLVPLIFVLCMTGAFALNNRFSDIVICLLFAILGYFCKKFGFPVIGVVLGMILGPIAENGFQQALMLSGGSYSIFFTRPISLILFLLMVLTLSGQFLKPYWDNYLRGRFEKKARG